MSPLAQQAVVPRVAGYATDRATGRRPGVSRHGIVIDPAGLRGHRRRQILLRGQHRTAPGQLPSHPQAEPGRHHQPCHAHRHEAEPRQEVGEGQQLHARPREERGQTAGQHVQGHHRRPERAQTASSTGQHQQPTKGRVTPGAVQPGSDSTAPDCHRPQEQEQPRGGIDNRDAAIRSNCPRAGSGEPQQQHMEAPACQLAAAEPFGPRPAQAAQQEPQAPVVAWPAAAGRRLPRKWVVSPGAHGRQLARARARTQAGARPPGARHRPPSPLHG